MKRKYPVPEVSYSVSTDGAGWFHLPFSTGENGVLLRRLKGVLNEQHSISE